jgi:hypothetical protein
MSRSWRHTLGWTVGPPGSSVLARPMNCVKPKSLLSSVLWHGPAGQQMIRVNTVEGNASGWCWGEVCGCAPDFEARARV